VIGRSRVVLPARPNGSGRRPATSLLLGALALTAVVAIGVGFADTIGLGGGGPNASPGPSGTGAASSAGPSTSDPGGANPPIDGVACDSLEHSAFHVHAHLAIRISGESRSIPADIGIRDGCLYWLHTHRDSGIVHVEAPGEQTYTLGQFFDIWRQPLTGDQVLDHVLTGGESVFVFVDGQPFDGDPRPLTLTDQRLIEVQVGPAPLEPLPFEFPADFL